MFEIELVILEMSQIYLKKNRSDRPDVSVILIPETDEKLNKTIILQ